MKLWKFGDYKTYTSLKLMTNVLGIPSPKDDIDGSEVYRVYYEENEIDRIIRYCEKDTIAVAHRTSLICQSLQPISRSPDLRLLRQRFPSGTHLE